MLLGKPLTRSVRISFFSVRMYILSNQSVRNQQLCNGHRQYMAILLYIHNNMSIQYSGWNKRGFPHLVFHKQAFLWWNARYQNSEKPSSSLLAYRVKTSEKRGRWRRSNQLAKGKYEDYCKRWEELRKGKRIHKINNEEKYGNKDKDQRNIRNVRSKM